MHSKSVPRITRAMLGAMIVGVGMTLASPHLLAQTRNAEMAVQGQAKSAMAAAQADFAEFVRHNIKTRSGTASDDFPLEVNDVQDLKDARIAYGFPVYTIDPNDVLSRSQMQSKAKATGEWRFVITLHDKPIGIATLEKENGRWETTSYGATVLAKDVDAAMGVHGDAQRSNVRFIRVFQAQSDFLEVTGADGRARFAPLHSARESLLMSQRAKKSRAAGVAADSAVSSDGLMDQADFLEPLRATVKANLDASK